jgi:hypothetical protein
VQRPASVGDAHYAQGMSMRLHDGPYNGHAMPSFGHCEERVRCAAFKLHVELEFGQTAHRIKGPTKRKRWIEQKQGMMRKCPNIDRSTGTKFQGEMGNGQ